MAVVLMGITYYTTFVWMVDRWMAADSYYSHGFLIPLVSGFLIWQRRERIAAGGIVPSAWGLVWLALGILLQLGSAVWRIYFTAGFSMLFVILGLIQFVFGTRAARETLFAVAFLVFMVPLPLSVIAELSLKLKLLAAHLAVRVISLTGIVAVQEGSMIHFPTCTMTVGDVCSGLRSIISLLALGAVFGHMRGLRWPYHLTLFVASVPIALCANVLRIVGLCFVANFWGVALATGTLHDLSGFLLFAVALAMLYGLETLLTRSTQAEVRCGVQKV
jgi:exosortase